MCLETEVRSVNDPIGIDQGKPRPPGCKYSLWRGNRKPRSRPAPPLLKHPLEYMFTCPFVTSMFPTSSTYGHVLLLYYWTIPSQLIYFRSLKHTSKPRIQAKKFSSGAFRSFLGVRWKRSTYSYMLVSTQNCNILKVM